ncbi:hypothetical protein [Flavimaricola marinus]|uniref:Uncharacterized protein n=1 Tax=Flavimaricola marinus TaxID=1819565 RepID=A0A238LC72_9RHOB|nr:hypothetical protein [Flavimaricola marinus]SMY06520.1 hypothetical protein LOM8899_00646 [Flavimaricola marinus]
MIGRARYLGAVLALLAAPVQAAEVYICWLGAGGYTMTGRMTFPDALMSAPIVTQDDVTSFRITGYFEERVIGKWDMADRTPQTSWLLRYQPRTAVFPLVGLDGLYQMWNANGDVTDCGVPGFGFNAGNGGQDFCIDNTFILSSSIEPDKPILGYAEPQLPGCTAPALLGKAP